MELEEFNLTDAKCLKIILFSFSQKHCITTDKYILSDPLVVLSSMFKEKFVYLSFCHCSSLIILESPCLSLYATVIFLT